MTNFDMDKLYCYACCHSDSNAEFPGRPSGERPCCFCIRNKDFMEKYGKGEKPIVDCWYDGTKPAKIPMDCYHGLDMMHTISNWEKNERIGVDALKKYFKKCLKSNMIDHSLRVEEKTDGSFYFYIHADGKDSDTLDLVIEKNGRLVLKKRV